MRGVKAVKEGRTSTQSGTMKRALLTVFTFAALLLCTAQDAMPGEPILAASKDAALPKFRPEVPQGMSRRTYAVLSSLLAGLSTTLGATVVLVMKATPTPEQMGFCLALAAGVMVTVSVAEMWLENLMKAEIRWQVVVSAALGAAAFAVLRQFIPDTHVHLKSDEDREALVEEDALSVEHHGKRWRLAILLMIALTAHNFPEGLAVAASSLDSPRLGLIVMAAITVHNIPEGIAIAIPVLDATGSTSQAIGMATLSGLAEPLGAIIAVTLLPDGALKGVGMDLLLAAVGGVMTTVAILELLPESLAQGRPWMTLAGLLAGFAIMMLTIQLA